jgi:ribosomal protein S18 acetylase RimI-like enzyme
MSTFDIRRPRGTDAAAIHDLVAEHDTSVIGRPDMTLTDVADVLEELDLENDSWLIHEGGRVLGWGYAQRQMDSDNVEIDVRARTPQAAALLWDTVTERARRLASEAGHAQVRMDIAVYEQDAAMRAAASERGFAPATSFHRMRIDFPAPAPASVPGTTVETGSPHDEELKRTAHGIQQVGFAQHFGFVPRTFEEWAETMERSSANDWNQLLVARADGEPAAMLLGTDQFVEDEDCGYVRTLAVLPRFRGRGLGKLLLGHAFAADERRGRVGTILHVDSNNTTPALGLYLSAGMRPVLAIDVWRKVVGGA